MKPPPDWTRGLIGGLLAGAIIFGFGLLKHVKLVDALRSSGFATLTIWMGWLLFVFWTWVLTRIPSQRRKPN